MGATRTSAGLLPYRLADGQLEVLVAHMGGPFWAKKDDGSWSIVKGEYEQGEDPYAAALREFTEEIGAEPPRSRPLELGELRQPGGKRIVAWALEGDLDPSLLRSNTFTLEWPRRSGRLQEFPEIDRAAWFDLATARRKLLAGQAPFLDALERRLGPRCAGLL
ncbi:MAG: NUDIX domain-containing protein [Solirubrobacteraceae bacterium]